MAATTFVWNVTRTAWNTAADWEPKAVPSDAGNNGSLNQDGVIRTSTWSIGNLTANNDGFYTAGQTLTVNTAAMEVWNAAADWNTGGTENRRAPAEVALAAAKEIAFVDPGVSDIRTLLSS